MRRFLLLPCTLFLFAISASAQKLDVAVGASTLFSSSQNTASLAFLPPPERGGVYLNASAQLLFTKRFGINGEIAIRRNKALYNGYQEFRPFLYDANAVFAPRINDNSRLDLMAGVGGQSVLFYNQFAICVTSTCPILFNSTHFAAHLGADVRYYFWGNFFFRPELHYYRVINNSEFHSDNLFRAGASVGYSFGR